MIMILQKIVFPIARCCQLELPEGNWVTSGDLNSVKKPFADNSRGLHGLHFTQSNPLASGKLA